MANGGPDDSWRSPREPGEGCPEVDFTFFKGGPPDFVKQAFTDKVVPGSALRNHLTKKHTTKDGEMQLLKDKRTCLANLERWEVVTEAQRRRLEGYVAILERAHRGERDPFNWDESDVRLLFKSPRALVKAHAHVTIALHTLNSSPPSGRRSRARRGRSRPGRTGTRRTRRR